MDSSQWKQKFCVRPGASSEYPKHKIYLDEIPLPKPKPIEKPVTVTLRGFVKDSTSNKVISDPRISITFINQVTNAMYKATVLPGGIYSVSNLTQGKYKVETNLAGFADFHEIHQISASSDEKNPINTILLSPVINGWRVVLTWGATPLDLDAHVVLQDGNSEINFDNRKSKDGKVTLDVDAKEGFGPETVSFVKPSPGIYKYYVNRYSNEAPLQKSGAKVKVYQGDKIYKTFAVPTGGDSTLDNWYVFDIDTNKNVLNEVNNLIASSG